MFKTRALNSNIKSIFLFFLTRDHKLKEKLFKKLMLSHNKFINKILLNLFTIQQPKEIYALMCMRKI